jgi:hypothetical protein
MFFFFFSSQFAGFVPAGVSGKRNRHLDTQLTIMVMLEQDFDLSLAAIASEIQRLEDQHDNPRWFALYLGVHYAKRGAAGGALDEGKPAPPSLSQDVLENIIALFDSVTVAEVLELRVRELLLKCEKILSTVHDICLPIVFIICTVKKPEQNGRTGTALRFDDSSGLTNRKSMRLKEIRKSNDKRAKDLATLLPTQDRKLRSRGAKPTHKGGGPIKQPGGGFRGN